MRQNLLKLLLCCLLFFTGTFVTAQGNCISAASSARTKLADARTALAAGDTVTAATLISEAESILLGACGDTTALAGDSGAIVNAPVVSSSTIAFVRFAHTAVDVEAIDIYLEAQGTTPLVAGLQYGGYTAFVTMPAEQQVFLVRAAGAAADSPPLYTLSANFTSNTSWLIYSAGVATEQAFVLKATSVIRSDYQGKARVRIINLVRSVERLGINTATGVLTGVLEYGVSSDMMVDAGSYSLRVVNGSQTAVSADVNIEFMSNTTNTLLMVGSDTNAPAIQLLNIVSPQEVGRVTFINNRIEAVTIYYRPANTQVIGLLESNNSTNFVTLPAGAVTFVAYASGAGPGSRELAALSTPLRPGRDLTILITDQGMELSQETLTPYGIDSGQ